MTSTLLECAICKRPTSLFNYGVTSCNACKMFYRRSLSAKNFPTKCEKSPDEPCSKCRYCRYQKCVTAGMNWKAPTDKKFDLPGILKNLKHLDSHRKRTVLNFTTMDNLGLDEIIMAKTTVTYTKKPKNFAPRFYEWALIYQTTSIDFMKKFEFVKEFSDSLDLKFFIKNSFVPYLMFCNTMRCYDSHQDTMDFPGGVDVYPNEIRMMFKDSPKVLEVNRGFLVARLIELKMREEEFLLLSAVLICNPATPNLSESARVLITKYQQIYSSALLDYCMNNYQQSGPTRFTDLLSFCYPVTKAFTDFGKMLVLFKIHYGNVQLKKIFMDLLDFVLE